MSDMDLAEYKIGTLFKARNGRIIKLYQITQNSSWPFRFLIKKQGKWEFSHSSRRSGHRISTVATDQLDAISKHVKNKVTAFPVRVVKHTIKHSDLIDRFATKAIGLFPLDENNISMLRNGHPPEHHIVAKFCYDLAYAMAAERKTRIAKNER